MKVYVVHKILTEIENSDVIIAPIADKKCFISWLNLWMETLMQM